MTTHVLAAIFGPLEMIFLFVLLASPVILTIAHFFFMARFKNNRLNIDMDFFSSPQSPQSSQRIRACNKT